MNWLAHLYLSEPSPAFQIGNLLPDFVSSPELATMPEIFQGGIRRHQAIDLFTDQHPMFRRSVRRFHSPYRRFGGILVDLIYDHFLTVRWETLTARPLPDFIAGVYAGFRQHQADLPPAISTELRRVQEANWIATYGTLEGLAAAWRRVGNRLKRPIDLSPAISVLEADYEGFAADFDAFFPELIAQVGYREPAPPGTVFSPV